MILGIILLFIIALWIFWSNNKVFKTKPGRVAAAFTSFYAFAPMDRYVNIWLDTAILVCLAILALIIDSHYQKKVGQLEQ